VLRINHFGGLNECCLSSGGKCPHVNKAVDITRVKKMLSTGGFLTECSECSKMTEISNGIPVGVKVGVACTGDVAQWKTESVDRARLSPCVVVTSLCLHD
jgi:hypothetical protein